MFGFLESPHQKYITVQNAESNLDICSQKATVEIRKNPSGNKRATDFTGETSTSQFLAAVKLDFPELKINVFYCKCSVSVSNSELKSVIASDVLKCDRKSCSVRILRPLRN